VLISRKRHKLRHSYNVQLIHVRDTYDALWYAENPISPLVVIHFSPLIWVIAVNTGFRHCAAHDDCLHSKIVCTQRTRDLLRQLWTERGSDESRDTCLVSRLVCLCLGLVSSSDTLYVYHSLCSVVLSVFRECIVVSILCSLLVVLRTELTVTCYFLLLTYLLLSDTLLCQLTLIKCKQHSPPRNCC